MAIPKIPSQKERYKKLNRRLANYVSLVQALYEKYNQRAAKVAIDAGYEGDGEFHFDSVRSKKLIADIQRDFVDDMHTIIYSGVSSEWRESNKIQDLLADNVLAFYDVVKKDGSKYRKYYQTNSDALKAFNDRRARGLNLSKNIWNQAEDYKVALEESISAGIQKGMSAITLSKRVSQYLNDFDKLRDDYTDKFGKASRVKNCEYRSIRLARSEINMAYRTAEQTRWKQMDFILGYEIKLSKAHKHEDICDCLAGKYPKDFQWAGWHPNDMCYAVPIIMSDEEFWGFDEDGNEVESSPRYVADVPSGFKSWVNEHRDKIERSIEYRTTPYYVRDNLNAIRNVWIKAPLYTDNASLSLSQILAKGIASDASITTESMFCDNGVYNAGRASIHRRIVRDYLKKGNAYGGDTVYMLGGGPANGKSTLVNSGKLKHPTGSLIIDADEVKAMIPEYDLMIKSGNPRLIAAAANFVHEESSHIGKMIQKEALASDMTIVIDGVNDGSYEKVAAKINQLRNRSNKRIRADYVSLDIDKSLRYAQTRAEKTGRTVPTSFIVDANAGVSNLIPKAIENVIFDELYLWDTNISGKPRLILSQIDGVLTIYHQKLYSKFLSKGSVK